MNYLTSKVLRSFLCLTIACGMFVACSDDDPASLPTISQDVQLSFELETINYLKTASDMDQPFQGKLRQIAQIPVVTRQKMSFSMTEANGFEAIIEEMTPTRTDLVNLHNQLPNDYNGPHRTEIKNGKIKMYNESGELLYDMTTATTTLDEIFNDLGVSSMSTDIEQGNLITGGIDYTQLKNDAIANGATVTALEPAGVFEIREAYIDPKMSNTLYNISIVDTNNDVLVVSKLLDHNNALLSFSAYQYGTNASGNIELKAIHQEVYNTESNGATTTTVNEYLFENINVNIPN